MHAARQACRPKHQVLILKCYPKFQKANPEVKPNSSELSYLLYYASTRRSKLQKVGEFLDKRAVADVWKGRIGNVQVTLEILKALIEKCPRDLPLYSGAVLRILRTILKSNDVSLVESSVPTFETFCAHQDPASLAANQDFLKQYEEIVQLYAQFASKEVTIQTKTPISWPVAIRFRKAGLQAIKAVAASESLSAETGMQLSVIIPVILLNVYSDDGDYLRRLESREHEKEDMDKEDTTRRRQSMSTVRTNEEVGDPIAASGTTEDADKLAEEEVGMVALQALRHIFLAVNRGQLRVATSAVLKFISGNIIGRSEKTGSWPTTLLAMVCGWTPVQDRYAILVGAMETLIRSPIVEEDLEKQLLLATIIDYLLSSNINFIGLSVMDVLTGLISHTLLLLQLGGNGSTIVPHAQQTTTVDAEKEAKTPRISGSLTGGVVMEVVKEPSQSRIRLLDTLQNCMGNLANHVYYTDQVSDMLSAILLRLKPSLASGVANTAAAIEDPVSAVDAVSSSASLQERTPHVDRFFSFEMARLRALAAVKDILRVANARRPDGSFNSVNRSRVGTNVWEGTQWLLRDPSGKVRKAYVDALITWLSLETNKSNLRVTEDKRKKENEENRLARRAVSNASRKEKTLKKNQHTFLSLLHLAIYENAHQYINSEPDIILLHLLLTTLVEKLGVNAARSGLPMIRRLQEDIQLLEQPVSKIRIGSLVHGYFWALSMAFDFETTSVGRTLHAEISRRNEHNIWMKSILVPPASLDRIPTPDTIATAVTVPSEIVQTEALKPFDDKVALVDRIAAGYAISLYSPPVSPPGSPGRNLSTPLLNVVKPQLTDELPDKVREQLLADWTKEQCIASVTKDSSVSSVTGSRSKRSSHQGNNYLGIKIPNGTLNSAENSPVPTPRLHSPNRGTNRSVSLTPKNPSSRGSMVRVDDLKRVLSGSAPRTSYSIRPRSLHFEEQDTASEESLMTISDASNESFHTPDMATSASPADDSPSTPAVTVTPKPVNNAARERDMAFGGGVPPVPPIPEALRGESVSPRPRTAVSGNGSVRRGKSRGRGSVREGVNGGKRKEVGTGRLDVGGFLEGIDVGEEEGGVDGGYRPPY